MKKRIPVIVTLIMLFQSAGYFLAFEIQQAIIREKVKEKIEKGVSDIELVLFKVPKGTENLKNNELQRVNKKEFRYRNKMYDIVRQRQCNDTIWYYCISDEKETSLFSNLDNIIKQLQDNDPNHKNQQQQQQRILNLLYDFQLLNNKFFINSSSEKWYYYQSDLINIQFDTIKPPPKHSHFI